MTTDNEYSDMGICPRCLTEGFDGVCDKCGYIERAERTERNHSYYNERTKRDDDYNYLINSEGD